MPCMPRAGQSASTCDDYKRGTGPLVCNSFSWGSVGDERVRLLSMTSLASADGLAAAAHRERGGPYRGGCDQYDRLLQRHALQDAVLDQDDEDGRRWAHVLPFISQLTGQYIEDSSKQSSMRDYLHVP